MKTIIKQSDTTNKKEIATPKKTWIESNQIFLQLIFNALVIYGVSTIYIQIWRMVTGH